MTTSNLATCTVCMLALTELSYIGDMKKYISKNTRVWENARRLELIAQAYILYTNPKYFEKGDFEMFKFNKKNSEKIPTVYSNRTKIIGGITVATGVATIASAVKDYLNEKNAPAFQDIPEVVFEQIPEITEDIADEIA